MAHAAKAEEMPGHKYIARVEIGTRRGKTLYRYFYTMDQYKQYLSQQKTGAKSEAEKRQSPLYNLKRLAAQVKAFAKDNNEANNGRSYKERNAARSRLSYDKVLLQTLEKNLLTAYWINLIFRQRMLIKSAMIRNENTCISSVLRCQTGNTAIFTRKILTISICSGCNTRQMSRSS